MPPRRTSVTSVIRFLLRTAIFLGSSAIGLLVAAWLVPGVSVSAWGFIAAVVIFTVAQAILSPFFLKMASRYASAFLGGIGLVSTLAALILASVLHARAEHPRNRILGRRNRHRAGWSARWRRCCCPFWS